MNSDWHYTWLFPIAPCWPWWRPPRPWSGRPCPSNVWRQVIFSVKSQMSCSKFSHLTIFFLDLGCGSGDLPNEWSALFGPFSDQFQVWATSQGWYVSKVFLSRRTRPSSWKPFWSYRTKSEIQFNGQETWVYFPIWFRYRPCFNKTILTVIFVTNQNSPVHLFLDLESLHLILS